MTDAEKREKVIDGLELCLEGLSDICPYKDSDAPGGCRDELMHDALVLLKAQEPCVMTVDEIRTLNNGDVVWIEFSDGRLLPMMVEDGCIHRWRYLWKICESAFYDDDYQARAWTSRPSDAQREATPWQ